MMHNSEQNVFTLHMLCIYTKRPSNARLRCTVVWLFQYTVRIRKHSAAFQTALMQYRVVKLILYCGPHTAHLSGLDQ